MDCQITAIALSVTPRDIRFIVTNWAQRGMSATLRIGTRGSQLAMAQTGAVVEALRAAHPNLDVQVVEILTSGDWKPSHGETRLAEAKGGKGLFAREIEEQILAGTIDCGVHSLKDMPSFLPEGLVIEHTLERLEARDVLLSETYKNLDELPIGAVVGTSSLRRQAFALLKRPDLKVVPLRGNVPTRIEKLHQGQAQAIFLALAGLKRLGLESHATQIFEPDEFLPAACQGIIGIETRRGDTRVHNLLAPIHVPSTGYQAAAERAALQVLDGSCRTPIGAYAQLNGSRMFLKCAVAAPDGSALYEDSIEGGIHSDEEAAALGQALGIRLKPRIPEELLTE